MQPSTCGGLNSEKTKTEQLARGALVYRFCPEGSSFNPWQFRREESLGKTGIPLSMGFNCPRGLGVEDAKSLARIVCAVFEHIPEPEFLNVNRESAIKRPGFLGRLNRALPAKDQVSLLKAIGSVDWRNTISLADYGMLWGVVYDGAAPLRVVIGLTHAHCGLKREITEQVSTELLRAVSAYCKGRKLDVPSEIIVRSQFDLLKLHQEQLSSEGKQFLDPESLAHTYASIMPTGIAKLEGWISRMAPHVESMEAEAFATLITLVAIVKLNKRERDFIRHQEAIGTSVAKILNELGKLCPAWYSEEMRVLLKQSPGSDAYISSMYTLDAN